MDSSDNANSKAMIEYYDCRIAELERKRELFLSERRHIVEKSNECSDCRDELQRVKGALESVLEDIRLYVKKDREKIDGRVKKLRILFDSIEASTRSPLINSQNENLDYSIRSVDENFTDYDNQIRRVDYDVRQVEYEIEQMRTMRGGLMNGQ